MTDTDDLLAKIQAANPAAYQVIQEKPEIKEMIGQWVGFISLFPPATQDKLLKDLYRQLGEIA